jgi:hypothetical protein
VHLPTVVEFQHVHFTGPVVGRFLAGLKEQKKIWGQRTDVEFCHLAFELSAAAQKTSARLSSISTQTRPAKVKHRNGERRRPATLAPSRRRGGVLWFGHLPRRAATRGDFD